MAYIEMKDITKRFGSVTANDKVNFSLEKGEIHALLGENGAGKSTLMNILFGMYEQTEGSIIIEGKPTKIKNSAHAIRLGIGMVHQHFMLVPMLNVIENVVLGHSEYKGVLNLRQAAIQFTEFAKQYGMAIDPFEIVGNLTVGQQQRLEILKALFRNAKLLILDEPTAVLTPQEVTDLFRMLRLLTNNGLTIIFITHKLNEVMEICDRCTVLRQGKKVATLDIKEIGDAQELATLMVGRNVALSIEKIDCIPKETILAVDGLSYRDEKNVERLNDVSFELHSGEILGICGVDGNGQSELIKCITGLKKPTSGKVQINNSDCTGMSPKTILKHSVSHIPEDRYKYGMIKDMSLNDNLILMRFDTVPYSKNGFLNRTWIKEHNEKLCDDYNVKTPGVFELAGNLSGGNQQKLVVGRELDRDPSLLIAVHPDRGLDIGATKYIQSQIVKARDRGAAVLMVSTELDEIMELSDKILVMFAGQSMGLYNQKDVTREKLGLLMAGVAKCDVVYDNSSAGTSE